MTTTVDYFWTNNYGKQRQLATILDKGTPDSDIWRLLLDKMTSYNYTYRLF